MIVRYKTPASQELTDAFDWYSARSPILGEHFLQAIEHTIARIRQHPESAPIKFDHVRSALVVGFPYTLHYIVDSGEILIYAVAHTRRKAHYWIDRLQ